MGWDVIFDSKTITANSSEDSKRVHLWDGRNVHAMQYTVTGSGTLDLSVQTSIDGLNWIDNGVKADNINSSSGPDGDGKDIVPLSLKPGDFFRVKALEVLGISDAVLSIWFVQK